MINKLLILFILIFSGLTAQETTIFETEQALNSSLKKLFDAAPNSTVNFYTGELLLHLNEAPFAILYLNRALTLAPHDKQIAQKLSEAETLAGVRSSHFTSPLISKATLLYLTLFFMLVATFLYSLYIWEESIRWKALSLAALSFSMLTLFAAVYMNYSMPEDAIIIKPTLFYKAAGFQYPVATNGPTLAGEKVQVLSIAEGGHWLKITDAIGNMGFVPYDTVRIISFF